MSEPAPLASPLPSLVVGDRLRLELWVPEKNDELAVLVERSRPTLAGFLPWAMHPPSIDEQRQVQGEQERQWREGRMASWSIVEDGAIVGMVGLHQRGGPDELEIGYWLDDEATGRGIMTDACAMAIEVAFTIDRIDVVEIVHDAGQPPLRGGPAAAGVRTDRRALGDTTGALRDRRQGPVDHATRRLARPRPSGDGARDVVTAAHRARAVARGCGRYSSVSTPIGQDTPVPPIPQ